MILLHYCSYAWSIVTFEFTYTVHIQVYVSIIINLDIIHLVCRTMYSI